MFEFSKSQINQLKNRGISVANAKAMIANINRQKTYCKIHRPATLGDGIIEFSTTDLQRYAKLYSDTANNFQVARFVPASGMATRMFSFLSPLFVEDRQAFAKALETYQNNPKVKQFLEGYRYFPFYKTMKEQMEGEHKTPGDKIDFLQAFIQTVHKQYANQPKAFVPFHKYGEQQRTAIEEQLMYAVQFALVNNRITHHFTISPGLEEAFDQHVREACLAIERTHNCTIDIDYSVQETSTDSLVVDANGQLVTDDQGQLVFRAAGHGALLQNLNNMDADLVFINNIDNVAPEAQHKDSGMYKRVLGGYLLHIQQEVFRLLRTIDKKGVLDEAIHFLDQHFHVHIQEDDIALRRQKVIDRLNRPLRVCGMVPNSGDPGGCPFWVEDEMGVHLQIAERAQVDLSQPSQAVHFQQGTHFNPVELVCSLVDFEGNPFDLRAFVDPSTYFIVAKTLNGKPIKSIEHPGLWNGSMAFWNTLFVLIPSSMFTPVKEIIDLLRSTHQN